MTDAGKIKSIIAKGEGLNIEFKKSYSALPRNVFETICAFLNRKGGHILLGVKDNGSIEDIREETLYLTDIHTNQSGYTLAAALVFGTDLMAFIRKHTPDRFYLEGNQRRSIRELIFREMVANLLVHREYSIRHPARITIYKGTVVSENGTIPNTMGLITPENVVPHPKNPTISDFFRQLGWVEDLGSGIRNMFHYCPIYVKNAMPIMEEGDVFKLTVRHEEEEVDDTVDLAKISQIKHADEVIDLIRENSRITAISIGNKLSLSENHIRKILARLVQLKIIERKGSDKDGEWMIG